MQEFFNTLTRSELIEFNLRSIYSKAGYTMIRPKKFEQAELYINNKNFVGQGGIITFMDADGHLLSLKPDVTLSVIKNAIAVKEQQKLYYSDEVYRLSQTSRQYEAIRQIGLEYIGEIDPKSIEEIITLALDSLKAISNNYMLDISHLGFVAKLLEDLDGGLKSEICENIVLKSQHGMEKLLKDIDLPDFLKNILTEITRLYGSFPTVLENARKLIINSDMETALRELECLYDSLKAKGLSEFVRIDFSAINNLSYYNGIIFHGYVKEIPSTILTGGRYDSLVSKMGGNNGAMGFAVKLDI